MFTFCKIENSFVKTHYVKNYFENCKIVSKKTGDTEISTYIPL